MPQTPENVVDGQASAEPVEAQRVAEAVPTQVSETPSTETSTSRRMTRSQTGRVSSKRRQADDAAPEAKKRATTASKKQKTISRQASASEEKDEAENASISNPTPPPPITPVVDEPMPPSTSRITFLEVSTAEDAQGERRISRSRAVFPVPVPNLTKKSRGRRVPTTQNIEEVPAAQPEKRVYICKVDGCGKCFHRGEHLKRHIRSIHTHEKPFKCTFPSCGKFFNRHDNLLQHLKVHKDTKAPRSQKASSANASEPGTPPPSGPPSQLQEPDSPTSEAPDSPVLSRPRTIYDHQPNLYAGYINAGPFESPAAFVTNMAVSSLRTEIPQSPTETHQPPTFAWHLNRPETMQDQLTY